MWLNTALKRVAVVYLTTVHICTRLLGRAVSGGYSTARGYRLHVDTWYDSLQLILPGFEMYFPYSNSLGMELIQDGLTACKSFLSRLIDFGGWRLDKDWRAKRMEPIFYTKPDQPPLIEHFLILHKCDQGTVYEFVDAKSWHRTATPPDLLLGNYFTTTYHCSFIWFAPDYSQQEAYDLVKKFYNPHRV